MDDDVTTAFRAAMRQTASPVSIVTARDAFGPRGLVATSVVSASMQPPTILYCVNKDSSFHPVLQKGLPFCVSLLSSDDEPVARHFGLSKGRERFSRGDWSSLDTEVPWLRTAQAAIFGTISAIIDWHTHTIVCGRVTRAVPRPSIRPLLYTSGDFVGA
jgi:flavin reductase (DIM6/NTAB) family NADH-FMN oxidoreductase RutF